MCVQQLFGVSYTWPPYSTAYPSIVNTLTNYPCYPINVTIKDNK
jgi:hypothetical protein